MDSVETIGESDWEDQDLLTHEEAGERLRLEVEGSIARIADLEESGIGPDELAFEKSRVVLMRERLDEVAEAISRKAETEQR